MQLSTDELFKALVTPLKEPRLVKELKTINANFTSQRENLAAYTESLEMVAAYSMFYLPTNIPKFNFIMNQLSESVQADIGSCDFIDVGTGPGTYILAFLDYFKDQAHENIFGLDSSSMMRKQADKMLKTFFPEQEFVVGTSLPEKSGKQMLFFGNTLNEMGMDAGLKIIDQQDAKYVMLIEPGTPDFFAQAIELRDQIKERGYEVLYPCFSSGGCPMREREGDWCHQVLRTSHHPSVERLSQLVSRDRRTMPLTGHIYKKGAVEAPSRKFRLVRYIKESKYAFEWEVCFFDSENKIAKVEVLKKEHSKSFWKELKKTKVGEAFELKILKELSPLHWRVKVLGDE